MPINQTLIAPLTIFSGSITSHRIPSGSEAGPVLTIPSSSLPAYQTSPWNYKITNWFTFNNSVIGPGSTSELTTTLANNTKYLVLGYLGVSQTVTTVGARIDFSASNATTNVYSIETPTSTTGIPTIGNNQSPATTTSPAADVTNFYFVKLTAIVTTAATGTPTITVQYGNSDNSVNITGLGPSILSWRAY